MSHRSCAEIGCSQSLTSGKTFNQFLRSNFDNLVQDGASAFADLRLATIWRRSVRSHNFLVLQSITEETDENLLSFLLVPNEQSEKSGTYTLSEFRFLLRQHVAEQIEKLSAGQGWSVAAQTHLLNQFTELSSDETNPFHLTRFAVRFAGSLKNRLRRRDLFATLTKKADDVAEHLYEDRIDLYQSPENELRGQELADLVKQSQIQVEKMPFNLNDYTRPIIYDMAAELVDRYDQIPTDEFASETAATRFVRTFIYKLSYLMSVNRLMIVQEVHELKVPNSQLRMSDRLQEAIRFAAYGASYLTHLTRRVHGRHAVLTQFSNVQGHSYEFLASDFRFSAFVAKEINVKNLNESQYESLLFLNLIGWQQQSYTDAIMGNGSPGLEVFVRRLFYDAANQPFLISHYFVPSIDVAATGIAEYKPATEAETSDEQLRKTSELLQRAKPY